MGSHNKASPKRVAASVDAPAGDGKLRLCVQ